MRRPSHRLAQVADEPVPQLGLVVVKEDVNVTLLHVLVSSSFPPLSLFFPHLFPSQSFPRRYLQSIDGAAPVEGLLQPSAQLVGLHRSVVAGLFLAVTFPPDAPRFLGHLSRLKYSSAHSNKARARGEREAGGSSVVRAREIASGREIARLLERGIVSAKSASGERARARARERERERRRSKFLEGSDPSSRACVLAPPVYFWHRSL